jgi:hypothetical protein
LLYDLLYSKLIAVEQVDSMLFNVIISCQFAVELFPRIFIFVYILMKMANFAQFDGAILIWQSTASY